MSRRSKVQQQEMFVATSEIRALAIRSIGRWTGYWRGTGLTPLRRIRAARSMQKTGGGYSA